MPREIPFDLRAEVKHDGVSCTLGPDPRSRTVLAVSMSGTAIAGSVAAAMLGVGDGFWLGFGLLALALGSLTALLWAQHAYLTVVEISDRAVTVAQPRRIGNRHVRIPLDELEPVHMSPPRYEGDTGVIVLRGAGQAIGIAPGAPADHHAWLLHAIAEAREHHRSRQALEGKEYRFMKKPPAEVESLRGRS